jgi:hypothetical protein
LRAPPTLSLIRHILIASIVDNPKTLIENTAAACELLCGCLNQTFGQRNIPFYASTIVPNSLNQVHAYKAPVSLRPGRGSSYSAARYIVNNRLRHEEQSTAQVSGAGTSAAAPSSKRCR